LLDCDRQVAHRPVLVLADVQVQRAILLQLLRQFAPLRVRQQRPVACLLIVNQPVDPFFPVTCHTVEEGARPHARHFNDLPDRLPASI